MNFTWRKKNAPNIYRYLHLSRKERLAWFREVVRVGLSVKAQAVEDKKFGLYLPMAPPRMYIKQ